MNLFRKSGNVYFLIYQTGFNDIVSCGVLIEDIFGDDATCQTDCTSSMGTYDESTLASYPSTLCSSHNAPADSTGHLNKPKELVSSQSNIKDGKQSWLSSWRLGSTHTANKKGERHPSTKLDYALPMEKKSVSEIPLKKSISSISAKSASSGRAPTPNEKSVLKERYECDESVTVYSV